MRISSFLLFFIFRRAFSRADRHVRSKQRGEHHRRRADFEHFAVFQHVGSERNAVRNLRLAEIRSTRPIESFRSGENPRRAARRTFPFDHDRRRTETAGFRIAQRRPAERRARSSDRTGSESLPADHRPTSQRNVATVRRFVRTDASGIVGRRRVDRLVARRSHQRRARSVRKGRRSSAGIERQQCEHERLADQPMLPVQSV